MSGGLKGLVIVAMLGGATLIYFSSSGSYQPSKEEQAGIDELLTEIPKRPTMTCVETGPFPYEPRRFEATRQQFRDEGRPIPFWLSSRATECRHCAELAELGILEVRKYEEEKGGGLYIGKDYMLTDLGHPLYRDNIYDGARENFPGVCFAEREAVHVYEYQPPLMISGVKHIGMKLQIEAVQPHALLFDERITSVGLKPLPKREDSQLQARFPAFVTTARLIPGAVGELDSSFRYGKYVNE